ncbi:hypothetical protein JCM21900_004462 [Sporobolomyces salmonicolor]
MVSRASSPVPDAGSAQYAAGLSRSSRLDSLSALAGGHSPGTHPSPLSLSSSAPSSPWGVSSSRGNSPTPPTSNFSGNPSPSLAPPEEATLAKPRSNRSASSSSGRTNTGFVVTSRTRNYLPPASPTLPSPPPLASTSAATASGSFFPPPSSSPSGSACAAIAALPPGFIHRRDSSPATFRCLPGAACNDHSHAGSSGAGGQGGEPKTTLTLSSSIDSKGRRMVNQYVRLKTIGQGSHGKVWLCAEPTIRELGEEDDGEGEEPEDEQDEETATERRRRRKGKHAQSPSERWEEDIDQGRVQYCAIKSVARDGPRRNKSLRMAKNRKASSQGSGGIGADDKVKREVAIMKRLDHPNIVRLKEVIDDAKSKKVFMVLEFMAGGQVVWQDENKQPAMTVDEARRTFRDVVLGLEYLHYQGIIHRDIKPANLLWTEDHKTVKISDFGVSHVSDALLRASPDDPAAAHGDDDKALRKTAGSPAFFAPELCHPAEYTPTPNAHPSQSHLAGDVDTYFPPVADASSFLPPIASTRSNTVYSPPTSPNGIPLSSKIISPPLPAPTPTHSRTRPPIGKGIDVWALGVTLYCLLFGDTPFSARTEYELYNVIVHEPIRVPEKMGREGAWTGVGIGWDGCGDGVEGREVVDLLGRLLEKDPIKRITLEQVKKHPWVLRNLSSPDSWLDATDPAQIDHVVVTEEDLQHATQERGAVDTLPPIRNRPGIRRALNAALARFPAFSRIKSTRTTTSTNSDVGEREHRSRSKSNSSTGHSIAEGVAVSETPATLSRHASDAAASMTGRKKASHEYIGADFRRVISGGAIGLGSTPRSPSPAAPIGLRGGWGSRSIRKNGHDAGPNSPAINPTIAFPELSRSISSSSVFHGTSPGARSAQVASGLFGRKPFDIDPSRSASSASSPSARTSHFSPGPWGSDTEGPQSPAASTTGNGRHRTLTKMLSRLSGSARGSRTSSPVPPARKYSDTTDEDAAALAPSAHIVEQFEARNHYDALGRLVRKSEDRSSFAAAKAAAAAKVELDDEGGIDLTEFEYSESDPDEDDDDEDDDDSDSDDLEDFGRPPLASANHYSGWNPPAFSDFTIGVQNPDDPTAALFTSSTAQPGTHGGTSPEVDPLASAFDKKDTPSFAHLDDPTPRAQVPLSTAVLRPDLSSASPPAFSLSAAPIERHISPGRPALSTGRRSSASRPTVSPRDGSIRGVSLEPPPPSRKGSGLSESGLGVGDDDDGEEEILVVPKRRRAATLSGHGPAGASPAPSPSSDTPTST